MVSAHCLPKNRFGTQVFQKTIQILFLNRQIFLKGLACIFQILSAGILGRTVLSAGQTRFSLSRPLLAVRKKKCLHQLLTSFNSLFACRPIEASTFEDIFSTSFSESLLFLESLSAS